MGDKNLLLASNDMKIAGAIAGLANYLGVNVKFARIAAVVLTVLTGMAPGVIAYVILLFVMTMNESKNSLGMN